MTAEEITWGVRPDPLSDPRLPLVLHVGHAVLRFRDTDHMQEWALAVFTWADAFRPPDSGEKDEPRPGEAVVCHIAGPDRSRAACGVPMPPGRGSSRAPLCDPCASAVAKGAP